MMALDELEENLRVGKNPRKLSRGEIKKLIEIAAEAGKGFCRNCGYCLPCPEGIPIPDVFRYESYYRQYGLEDWARFQYNALSSIAQGCSDCQTCLEKCPYGVPIPTGLKKAHNLLSGKRNKHGTPLVEIRILGKTKGDEILSWIKKNLRKREKAK